MILTLPIFFFIYYAVALVLVDGNSSITGQLCSETTFQLNLDNPATELHYREDLVCLGMFTCSCTALKKLNSKDNPIRYLEALALRLCDDGKDQYERVGIVTIPESTYGFYVGNETEDGHSLVIV
jgi:hypothetical protein